MQQRGAAQVAQLARAVAEHVGRSPTAMRATPTEWRAGVGRLGVDDQRERLGDAVEPLVVGVLDAVRGLEGADHRVRLVAAERAPERAVAAGRAQRVDQRGVEPACRGARRRRRTRRAGRAAAKNTSTVWARQTMRPSSGICVAAQAVGVAAAVPVLVERADRLARSPRCSSSMRAISAPRSQRSSVISRAPSAPLRAIARQPAACGASSATRVRAATSHGRRWSRQLARRA